MQSINLRGTSYFRHNPADKSVEAFVPQWGISVKIGNRANADAPKPTGPVADMAEEFKLLEFKNIKSVPPLHIFAARGPEGEYRAVGSHNRYLLFPLMRFKRSKDASLWVLDKDASKGSSYEGKDTLFNINKSLEQFSNLIGRPEEENIFEATEKPKNKIELRRILDKHEGEEFDLFLKILGENKIALSDDQNALQRTVEEMEKDRSGVCVFELDAPASR